MFAYYERKKSYKRDKTNDFCYSPGYQSFRQTLGTCKRFAYARDLIEKLGISFGLRLPLVRRLKKQTYNISRRLYQSYISPGPIISLLRRSVLLEPTYIKWSVGCYISVSVLNYTMTFNEFGYNENASNVDAFALNYQRQDTII